MVVYGTVNKEVQLVTRYYDVLGAKFVGGGTTAALPLPLKPGGFASGTNLNLSPGEYELKCYAEDKLIAVMPFEVK